MSRTPPPNELEIALDALGSVLGARGQHYELVIIGGAALLFRGVVARPTKDVDVLGLRSRSGLERLDALPPGLSDAVADVAATYGLRPDWLNVGPRSLLDFGPPDGFEERLERVARGDLVCWYAGRRDLVFFKLYAAADAWPLQDRHLHDLRALEPTLAELLAARSWALTHDPSPGFSQNLTALLRALGVKSERDDG